MNSKILICLIKKYFLSFYFILIVMAHGFNSFLQGLIEIKNKESSFLFLIYVCQYCLIVYSSVIESDIAMCEKIIQSNYSPGRFLVGIDF